MRVVSKTSQTSRNVLKGIHFVCPQPCICIVNSLPYVFMFSRDVHLGSRYQYWVIAISGNEESEQSPAATYIHGSGYCGDGIIQRWVGLATDRAELMLIRPEGGQDAKEKSLWATLQGVSCEGAPAICNAIHLQVVCRPQKKSSDSFLSKHSSQLCNNVRFPQSYHSALPLCSCS